MSNEAVSTHYDDAYFRRQVDIGTFGGWANQSKFSQHIKPEHDVLDFGCGGGFLLKGMDCRRKMGVEVNPVAAETARKSGIEVFASVGDVPDDSADVIISNSALEHTLRPLDELKALRSKLRPGGKIVVVVPCEAIGVAYKPNDVNNHLYTWSPLNLGNLLNEAGFRVIEAKPYIHKWPPKWRKFQRFFMRNRAIFEAVCRVSGHMRRKWFQVRAVAERAASD